MHSLFDLTHKYVSAGIILRTFRCEILVRVLVAEV